MRVPRKVQAKGKFVGRLVPEQVPRYMLCSSRCVHKILAKVEKELDDAFKAVRAGGQSER